MSKYIAALDQGTTSTRCILFDKQGNIVCASQKEHSQIYPKAGWVEHDPNEIIERTRDVISDVIRQSNASNNDIAGMGITNQRETIVVWDKTTGIPYYNAIVWQDTRTKEICDKLAQEGGIDRFRKITGLPLATYFSGPKLAWVLDHVDGIREEANKGKAMFGTIDTWLIWWLTGGPTGGSHVTDVTNASRTLFMDLQSLDWNQEILDILNIPRSMLATIVPSSDPRSWGEINFEDSNHKPIPITGALGDQQAALIGQTCFNIGEVKNTYGTGCFMLMNTGEQIVNSENGLLTTVGYKLGDKPAVYALEGSVAIAGALVQWLRDNLGVISSAPEIETLANKVEDNGGIYFVPAFSGLFAPYWRSDARGVIVGMTRYTNGAHLARATLEATAYQTRDVLTAMQEDSSVRLKELRVDGGMVHNELLMQFQSDIVNVPVIRPKISETTALGAAYAAGLAVGFWDDTEQLSSNWQIDKIWKPEMNDRERDNLYSQWGKAIQRSFNWV